MSTVQRQAVISLCLALIIFVLSMVIAFLAYPLPDWSALWTTEIMDLPFIIIAPSISLIVGLFFGIISGMGMKKQLNMISDTLLSIEQGRNFEDLLEYQTTEFEVVRDRLKKVQKHIADQIKTSQKLANEKAIDQEKRIQEIVSEERNRLARELHDSVSQQLFAASMMMSAINETRPITDDVGTRQLKMVEEMIHQSQLEMRALLLHLRPVALKGKSLQEGIRELLLELSQKVPVQIDSKIESFHIEKGVEDHLFRILQESVSNTLRHSKANHLEVMLIERDEFVILRIVDDGIGFNVEETKAGSYGLHNMHERAVEIGGSMRIISMKNKGTRIEVKIPLVK